MKLPVRVRTRKPKAKIPSFIFFCVGCHQNVWLRFLVGLPISNNLIKKIYHWSAQQLGFQLTLYVVNLTTKISSYTPFSPSHSSSFFFSSFFSPSFYYVGKNYALATQQLHHHIITSVQITVFLLYSHMEDVADIPRALV